MEVSMVLLPETKSLRVPFKLLCVSLMLSLTYLRAGRMSALRLNICKNQWRALGKYYGNVVFLLTLSKSLFSNAMFAPMVSVMLLSSASTSTVAMVG